MLKRIKRIKSVTKPVLCKNILTVLLPLLLCAFSSPVYADMGTAVSYEIPVSIASDGSGNSYMVILTPENGETESVTVKEGGTAAFTETYDEPGVYSYTVKENSEGIKSEDLTADETVYTVYVIVEYGEDNRLTASMTAKKGTSDEKPDEVTFKNKYKEETSGKKDANNRSKDTAESAAKNGTAGNVDTGDRQATGIFMMAMICAAIVLVLAAGRKKEERHYAE